jgi:opacity protein-like surface antigen
MKRAILVLCMMIFGGTALLAQTPSNPWTWQIQAGYNNNTGWMKNGWNGTTSLGYRFTDSFKLNLDLGYFEGKVKDTHVKSHIWTLMLAPTYVYDVSNSDQVYAFVGAGVADRRSGEYEIAGLMPVRFPSATKWAAEAGVGYNHFFNQNVGLNLQASYTHMAFAQRLNPVDARVGLVIKF